MEAPRIRGANLPDAAPINESILKAFSSLGPADFSRRSHFFGGRFENLYLDRRRIPELERVLQWAERCGRAILNWGPRPLRCGFWFNAQGPGQSTSEHTHEELEELEELLSGVYYLKVPERSGDIRRLTGNLIPDCAGFSFVFKARQRAHSELCNGCRNAEDGRKDKQAGMRFFGNRLSIGR